MERNVDPLIRDAPDVERCERAIHLFGSSRVYVKFDDLGQPLGYYQAPEGIIRAGEPEPTVLGMKFFGRELSRLITGHS